MRHEGFCLNSETLRKEPGRKVRAFPPADEGQNMYPLATPGQQRTQGTDLKTREEQNALAVDQK